MLTFEQANEREGLVFDRAYIDENYQLGGVAWFDEMSVETAKKLIEKGYIDPDDAQNNAPCAQEMVDFCDDGSGKWYLHGYVVSRDRDDSRISFEGVGSHGPITAEDALWFTKAFRYADNLNVEIGGEAYCWFD